MFTKVSFLSVYISVHKFDINCPFEILSDNKNLEIPGCNLVREDHSSNSKRGVVCLYYKRSLPFAITNVKLLKSLFHLN